MKTLQLQDYIQESEIQGLLESLIRIDSSNPPAREEPVARLLAGILGDAGLEVNVSEFAPGRANVVARWRGEGRKAALVFSGHLDTVPVGQAAWQYPPHAAVVEDGVLYGRGAVDMKGAVAAMTAACVALARAGLRLAGDVVLAGTAGEEVDSIGARKLVAEGIGPVGEVVVGEPTRLDVAPAHKGALWIEIETVGKAAHGSMPEQGCNAVLAMHEIIGRLAGFRKNVPPHPLLGGATVNIGTIAGGIKPNIVPDRCRMTVDLRTLPGESHEAILKELEPLLGGATVRVLNSMPAVETAVEAPLIQAALEISRELFGQSRGPRGMTYYSDASVLEPAWKVPVLICGPGDERLAHQVDERVALADVFAAARLYFGLAQARLG